MWYGGNNETEFAIGYATSADGITWTKYANNPVLTKGPSGAWDDGGVWVPTVAKNGTKYHMMYAKQIGPNEGPVGHAVSNDGITWSKDTANPVFNPGGAGKWDKDRIYPGSLMYKNGMFHLWYGGSYDASNIWQIGHATSPFLLGKTFRTFEVDTSLSLKANKLVIKKKGSRAILPNSANWRDSVITRFNPRKGITIGIPQSDVTEAKKYGWVRFKKGSGFGKFFKRVDDNISFNAPFDSIRILGSTKKKAFVKEFSPTSSTYSNPLLQSFSVFKLNLLSSKLGITPESLYALTYNEPGNMWNGMSLSQMQNALDTVCTYYKTKSLPNGQTASVGNPELENIRTVLNKINSAFYTSISLTNGDSVVKNRGLRFPGIIDLAATPFLQWNSTQANQKIFSKTHIENEEPEKFCLNQNFPNPFNPTTAISFSLKHKAFVSLKVFDVIGRDVATLLNEEIDSGEHETTFDASNLSSGVYFYRLNVNNGEFVENKKLVLLK